MKWMENPQVKKCSNCGFVKELSDYSYRSNNSGKRILNSQCRICLREKASIYLKKNYKIRYLKNREWIAKNKNKVRKYQRKSRKKHRKEINARALEYYHKTKDKKHGVRLERLYGITLSQYYELLSKNGGKCPICGIDKPYGEEYMGPKRYFAVDHDHKTGVVRGVLCHRCNTGIGSFKDSIDSLKKAIEYLEKFKGVDNRT